jgi:hypothetical protein
MQGRTFFLIIRGIFYFMEVVKLSIRLIEGNLARVQGRNLFQYNSEVIRNDGKFYYRVNSTTLEITPVEARRVIKNPCLYYFSTALTLHSHLREIKNLVKGIMDKLDLISKFVSRLSIEQIENLSDEEILKLRIERPNHPGQFGFLLVPKYFKKDGHLSQASYALIKRLGNVQK